MSGIKNYQEHLYKQSLLAEDNNEHRNKIIIIGKSLSGKTAIGLRITEVLKDEFGIDVEWTEQPHNQTPEQLQKSLSSAKDTEWELTVATTYKVKRD